ncbi:MAG TPA: MMPL family transporter [Flavobacteriales bacterium]|nr:MMPL family transporter [Flavobacteriales bacterium]HMR28699.1 MMPL family transporter [Flavobacteriales bacterium]
MTGGGERGGLMPPPTRPRWVPIALALFSVWSAIGLSKVRFSYDIDRFFPQDDPAVAEYRAHKELFGDEMRLLLVGLELPGALDSAALGTIAHTTVVLEQLPFVTGVRSLTNLSEPMKMPLGDWISAPYFNAPFGDPKGVLERLQTRPSVLGLFLSTDQRATTLIVELDSLPSKTERADAFRALHVVLDRTGVQYHLAGRLVTQAHYLHATQEQLGRLSLMALALMAVVLFVLFRHPVTALSPLLVCALALLWTFGPMGWLGIGVEPLLSLLPALLLVLGSSFSIHILSRFRAFAEVGVTPEEAMQSALRETTAANLLSAVSTVIGFSTLAFYAILPLRVFGLAAAWGLVAALVAARTVLPLIVGALKLPQATTHRQRSMGSAGWIFSRGKYTLSATAALLVGGAFAYQHLVVDNHFLDDLDRSSTLGVDATFFEEHFSGTRPLEIAITPVAPDKDLLDPGVLAATDSLVAGLGSVLNIVPPLAPTDVTRAAMHGLYLGEGLPTDSMAEKQVRRAVKQFARAHQGPQLINADLRHGRITGRLPDIGSFAFKEAVRRLEPLLHNDRIQATITGGAWLMDIANRRIATVLVQGILTAILLNALLVGAFTRSWRKGLISIVPNVLPLAFAAVLMALFGVPLKVGTAMIFPILYGIALDDTMHYLLHARDNTLRANLRTWHTLRRSLFGTTLVITAGFALFGFASFPSIAVFGLITAASLWVALAADLWLLPVLLGVRRGDWSS